MNFDMNEKNIKNKIFDKGCRCHEVIRNRSN